MTELGLVMAMRVKDQVKVIRAKRPEGNSSLNATGISSFFRDIVWWTLRSWLFLDMYRRHSSNSPDNICHRDLTWAKFEIDPLANILEGSIRKYSRQSIKLALDAILNRGETVTQASIDYGIKRTSLQHYLKKLNIKIKSSFCV